MEIVVEKKNHNTLYKSLLVYGTEALSPAELMIPSLRVFQTWKKENEKDVFMAERCEDLEEVDEKRDEKKDVCIFISLL